MYIYIYVCICLYSTHQTTMQLLYKQNENEPILMFNLDPSPLHICFIWYLVFFQRPAASEIYYNLMLSHHFCILLCLEIKITIPYYSCFFVLSQKDLSTMLDSWPIEAIDFCALRKKRHKEPMSVFHNLNLVQNYSKSFILWDQFYLIHSLR